MEILALSYIYLPARLQGFFYYLGAFPEDCEICASKLIKLWVAEGFFPKPALPTQTMDNYCSLWLLNLVVCNIYQMSINILYWNVNNLYWNFNNAKTIHLIIKEQLFSLNFFIWNKFWYHDHTTHVNNLHIKCQQPIAKCQQLVNNLYKVSITQKQFL